VDTYGRACSPSGVLSKKPKAEADTQCYAIKPSRMVGRTGSAIACPPSPFLGIDLSSENRLSLSCGRIASRLHARLATFRACSLAKAGPRARVVPPQLIAPTRGVRTSTSTRRPVWTASRRSMRSAQRTAQRSSSRLRRLRGVRRTSTSRISALSLALNRSTVVDRLDTRTMDHMPECVKLIFWTCCISATCAHCTK
jgi:hypothetical protein